jgi:urea-proton symporter
MRRTYFKPDASGEALIFMAHSCVIGFGVFMAGFSTGLFYIGISMGYLYLLMGVIVSSAVIPATLTLLWKRQNAIAATATPVLGLICSLIAWLVTAKKEGGGLSVPSTGANNPMLAGNVVALLSPLVFVPVLTYGFGADNYDYESMKSIRRGEDSGMAAEAHLDLELVPGAITWSEAEEREEQSKLLRDSKIAKATTVGMALALLVLWPMPLYGTGYIFSKPFFTGWVVVGIIWLFFSLCCVSLFPLWEGRYSMVRIFKAVFVDLTSGREDTVQRIEPPLTSIVHRSPEDYRQVPAQKTAVHLFPSTTETWSKTSPRQG